MMQKNQLSLSAIVQEDGTGFHVRNGGTQETLRTVRRSYGYKLQQRLMVDSMKAGYTVVCYLPALLMIPDRCPADTQL
jgi:hypothetical protein